MCFKTHYAHLYYIWVCGGVIRQYSIMVPYNATKRLQSGKRKIISKKQPFEHVFRNENTCVRIEPILGEFDLSSLGAWVD